MSRRVTVDKETCIGCGACRDTCPDVFEGTEEGKSQVKKGAKLTLPCVQKAADECPVEAIKVED